MFTSMKQSYNIVIALILPILYISNAIWNAVIETGAIIATMGCNGFQETKLCPIQQYILVLRDFSGIQIKLTMFEILVLEGHFTHETEGPRQLHSKISHWSPMLRLFTFTSC